jgi:DNA-binding SARP family transcriptional activator
MEAPCLPEPYQSLVDSGQLSSCSKLLEQDGLSWVFNLQIPQIMIFMPLIEQLSDGSQLSPRLTLMRQAVNPQCNADELFSLLDMLKQDEDLEGLAACIMLALGAIWEESHDFTKFAPWLDEAESLVGSGQLSLLAHAALMLQCLWSEVAWQSDLEAVVKAIPETYRMAEQAQSPSIMLMCSTLGIYVYGWYGDLAAAELLLMNSEPCLSSPQASPLAVQQYSSAKGLLLTLQGDTQSAEAIYSRLLEEELISFIPNSAWLLIHANYLHCLVAAGDKLGAERVGEIIIARTVSEQKWYYHSYLHFNLAVAELTADRPHKALLHAEEASRRGELCYSVNAVRMPALLKGQALVDLQRDDEAEEFFAEWIPKWEQAHFYLIAAQACFEMAAVYHRKGEYDAARCYLDKAASLTPLNEMVPVIYRREGYQDQLRRSVYRLRYERLRLRSPVFIQCLGGFAIAACGKRVDLAVLKGKRSASLLKMIISMGCTEVPVELVADAMWPDADGDKALGAFKVALSRLRGVLRDIYSEANLINVKGGAVSVDLSLCAFDWKIFEERAERLITANITDEVKINDVMDMYVGAYLPEDGEEVCHVNRRDKLKSLYISLGLLLAEKFRIADRRDKESACLENLLKHDSANEQLYLALMESCIAQGFSAKALEVYAQAEKSLQDAYGVGPGDGLVKLARKVKDLS